MTGHRETPTPRSTFRIGEWLVRPELCEISRGGERTHLEPKVMDVLVHLAAHAGEVVSKQELTDAVWRVGYISDSRLTRVIADLRQALGDEASDPRYVETIPTRGYRLVSAVRDAAEAESDDSDTESTFKLEVAGRGYSIASGENIIGRGADVDIRIESEWVSRVHARIVVDDERAFIEDLGSKNGTYLHGVRLTGRAELHDGDEIGVGRGVISIRFVRAVGSTRTETEIDLVEA